MTAFSFISPSAPSPISFKSLSPSPQPLQRRLQADLTEPVPSRQQQPVANRGTVTLWAKHYNSDMCAKRYNSDSVG